LVEGVNRGLNLNVSGCHKRELLGIFGDVEFLEATVQGASTNAEFFGCSRSVATAFLKSAENKRLFGLVQI
jgi:hypothetical protein